MSNVLDSVMGQYEKNTKKYTPKVSDEERLKKYFSTNLPKEEEIGTRTFRIIPPKDGGSPFTEVHYHELKVGGKWRKLYCLKHNKEKQTCPLCEVEAGLKEEGTKQSKDLAKNYRARKFYITKGVDRALEDHGPKFWRFRHNWKKQGILDKIIPIFTAKGDITNAENGRDLIISIGRDDKNYCKVTTIMQDDMCPLSEDAEQAQAWIDDKMTFRDVYATPTFEYLEIIALGGEPYWDKDAEKYVTKEEWEEKQNTGVKVEDVEDDNDEYEDATEVEVATDVKVEEVEEEKEKPAKKTTRKKVTPKKEVKKEVDEDDDEGDDELEDLPF